jgi:hypothetical protein
VGADLFLQVQQSLGKEKVTLSVAFDRLVVKFGASEHCLHLLTPICPVAWHMGRDWTEHEDGESAR